MKYSHVSDVSTDILFVRFFFFKNPRSRRARKTLRDPACRFRFSGRLRAANRTADTPLIPPPRRPVRKRNRRAQRTSVRTVRDPTTFLVASANKRIRLSNRRRDFCFYRHAAREPKDVRPICARRSSTIGGRLVNNSSGPRRAGLSAAVRFV